MAAVLQHRGPDDAGIWSDEAAGIAFGFRRLSIIDTSQAGHQPMTSANGRYTIVFNGEVYNALHLRDRLPFELSSGFRGHSDTEVMLTAFEHWGIGAAVQEFIGMFAFAVWDHEERQLWLCRDRMGVKPLYYGSFGNRLLFGSELRALRAHYASDSRVDRDALTLFLRYGYYPQPWTAFENVRQLPPGALWSWKDGPNPSTTNAFWKLSDVARTAAESQSTLSDTTAQAILKEKLEDSVRLRLQSDVPLGAFLSGGIDSSLVVALMQRLGSGKVRTFSIGFEQPSYNEAPFAKRIAEHLGTEHTEHILSAGEAMDVIYELPEIYDEPFADASQVPTYLVSHLARQHVTVSLSGDGGDELFGGYNRYRYGPRIWNAMRAVPPAFRAVAATLMQTAASFRRDGAGAPSRADFPSTLSQYGTGGKLRRLADLFNERDFSAYFRSIVSQWQGADQAVLGATPPPALLSEPGRWPEGLGVLDLMCYLDQSTYLPDDILVKVDRASMAVGLEAREPLLDHRVVEFAWSLPESMKLRNNTGKWLLRQLLYEYVPRKLLDRPKMGFAMPIGLWMRGPLKEWVESLLDTQRIRQEGYLNPVPIGKLWDEHKEETRDNQYALWPVLMFQAWLEKQRDLR